MTALGVDFCQEACWWVWGLLLSSLKVYPRSLFQTVTNLLPGMWGWLCPPQPASQASARQTPHQASRPDEHPSSCEALLPSSRTHLCCQHPPGPIWLEPCQSLLLHGLIQSGDFVLGCIQVSNVDVVQFVSAFFLLLPVLLLSYPKNHLKSHVMSFSCIFSSKSSTSSSYL